MSNATTIGQLGVSPGQSVELSVQVQQLNEPTESSNVNKEHKKAAVPVKHKKVKKGQTTFTVQVRIGK